MLGLDADILDATLDAIREFAERQLPVERQLQLDHEDECPVDMVRAMCGDELGVQLLFIPEEYGGMGGGTFDVYRVCEAMARIDLGVATSVLNGIAVGSFAAIIVYQLMNYLSKRGVFRDGGPSALAPVVTAPGEATVPAPRLTDESGHETRPPAPAV
jgi:alkylation response protein AidB-like acyl-CoA dehydrogenase